MNIGIVTAWFPSGAGYVSKSYECLLEKHHRVFIYARGTRVMANDPLWDHHNVTWSPPHPCSTGIHHRHFAHWVRRHSIDAIIFNEQRRWDIVLKARKLGLLVGAYVDYYTVETVPFFQLYDFLICHTLRHYNLFREHPQVCYCPWGTQIERFKPAEFRSERPITFLTSAGWNGELARLNPWMDRRGTGVSMRVFNKVTENCRLIVFSQVPLEDCPDEWQLAVQNDARIEFRVGTFAPFPYTLGDIYVYPANVDGIGLTLPEAISCGLPAITTDTPPMKEFMSGAEHGVLLKVKEYHARPDGYYWPLAIVDEASLLEAFQFYSRDPSNVLTHSTAARTHAEKHLCWDKNAAFLPEWLTKQAKLSNRSDIDLKRLGASALKYDRRINPTPAQALLVGGYSMALHIRKRYFVRN